MQLLIVPKQACNVTEGLSQNTVLQYVVISYLEEYFSAYLHSGTRSYIKLFRILNLRLYRNFIDLDLMRCVSVDDFNNVSLFFLVIFATNFDIIFKDHPFCSHIFKHLKLKLTPKTNHFS